MREALLAVVLASAGLAGCIGGEDANTAPASQPEEGSVPEQLALDGCREFIAVWEMEYEDVSPYLPPGFEPASISGENAERNASLHLLGITCTEPREMGIFLPWLPVEPNEEWADPDADLQRVSLPCIGDAEIANALQAWDAPCETGNVTIASNGESPAGGGSWTLRADSSQRTVEMTGAAPNSTEPVSHDRITMYHVSDQQVCSVTSAVEFGVHYHWQFGAFSLAVEGEAGFPVPDEPGVGVLAPGGFEMVVEPTSDEVGPPADEITCSDEGTDEETMGAQR